MIAAVIPTRNEPDLAPFLQCVASQVDRVLIVDDSTTLKAQGQVANLGYPTVHGIGSLAGSLLYGLSYWNLGEADRVVTIDAGWSHDPDDIPRLLHADADIVIGSRFHPEGEHAGPWWRWMGSQTYAAAWRLKTGDDIRDWTSGYRVYSRYAMEVVADATFTGTRHGFQAEVLNHLLANGCSVEEVPISYRVMPGSTLSWPAVREALGLLVR